MHGSATWRTFNLNNSYQARNDFSPITFHKTYNFHYQGMLAYSIMLPARFTLSLHILLAKSIL